MHHIFNWCKSSRIQHKSYPNPLFPRVSVIQLIRLNCSAAPHHKPEASYITPTVTWQTGRRMAALLENLTLYSVRHSIARNWMDLSSHSKRCHAVPRCLERASDKKALIGTLPRAACLWIDCLPWFSFDEKTQKTHSLLAPYLQPLPCSKPSLLECMFKGFWFQRKIKKS